MACRPVDRGFCRMGETKVPFRPPKGGFGRTKVLIAEVQAQASRFIELGAALELNDCRPFIPVALPVSNVYSQVKEFFDFPSDSVTREGRN